MPRRVSTRNADFQQWHSLLANRTKRSRTREFLVQGVRPISMAVEHGWTIRTLLHDERSDLSSWARGIRASVAAEQVAVTGDLLAELGERSAGPPELIAVVEMPPDDLVRVPAAPAPLVVVFDRPSSPGNIGTLIRSLDAFGATALVVTGHAADPYDPRCVRASTGSFFAVPTVRVPSHREVVDWVSQQRRHTPGLTIVGTDEKASLDVREADLGQPTVLVVGNETVGLTAAWRSACDRLVGIPMLGTASSLNAATAGSIALYEAMRQRHSS
jgi:23S rRNA (uridine2479-2'-O)-methyltransferase